MKDVQTLEKAARMALEALKQIDEAMPFPVAKFAQAALRQALEQPAQQQEWRGPVDWEAVAADQAMTIAMMKSQRKPWVGLTDEMVVAAARMLSDRQAAECNVDCGDMWKMHGNDFIEDARAALEAAHGIKEQP